MNDFDQAGELSAARMQVTHVVRDAAAREHISAITTIFRAGLVCGVLDITAAFITWNLSDVRPFRILQGIALGLLGPESFHGGWPTALLGAGCHFFIAFPSLRCSTPSAGNGASSRNT